MMSNNHLAMLGLAAATAASASLYVAPGTVAPPTRPAATQVAQRPSNNGRPTVAPIATPATASAPQSTSMSGLAATVRDNRQLTEHNDRKNGFARFVCQVWADDPGSGVLLSPQHVLTAAHNVFDGNGLPFKRIAEVRPGFDNSETKEGTPILTRRVTHCIRQRHFELTSKFLEERGSAATEDDRQLRRSFDIAVLVLESPVYNIKGPFPKPTVVHELEIGRRRFHLNGYDAPKGRKEPPHSKMSGHRQVTRTLVVSPIRHIYDGPYKQPWWFPFRALNKLPISLYEAPEAYTSAGASGGPVWYEKDGQFWVVGIHTSGFQLGADKGSKGILFDEQYIEWLEWALQQTP